MDKVSLVKMEKAVATKVELAKHILRISLCFNNIKLSDTETTVMAYFMVYGVNQQSKNLLIKSAVCKNLQNIKTIMVKLKKLGLIYKDDFNGKVYIAEALAFELTPTIAMYLKVVTAP